MKVVLATNHTYPPQRAGGSESSLHDLATALQARGVQATVLCQLSWRAALRRPQQVLWLGRSYVQDRRFGYVVVRARDPVAAIPRLVRDFQPDVALAQVERPIQLADGFLAAGVPAIVYVRDVTFSRLGGTPHPALRFLTNSAFCARRFHETYGMESEWIPPLIQPERYRVAPSRRTHVTFVCPVRGKGVEIALALAAARRDVPFVFQESWPMNGAAWDALKARAGPLDNVKLQRITGDMREVYRTTRLLLVPSIVEEAWGRVVTEAQINGIPVLASTRGGLPESVGDGGVLVDPDAGIDVWVRAFSRIWDDPAEYGRLSDAAVRRAGRVDLQPAAIIDCLLAILSRTAAQGAGGPGKAVSR